MFPPAVRPIGQKASPGPYTKGRIKGLASNALDDAQRPSKQNKSRAGGKQNRLGASG
jgi:hypothetical protein